MQGHVYGMGRMIAPLLSKAEGVMTTSDPLTCLMIALAHYTNLPVDSDLVKKMTQVVIGMSPYLPQAMETGYGNINLYFEAGKLKSVAPAPSYLVK